MDCYIRLKYDENIEYSYEEFRYFVAQLTKFCDSHLFNWYFISPLELDYLDFFLLKVNGVNSYKLLSIYQPFLNSNFMNVEMFPVNVAKYDALGDFGQFDIDELKLKAYNPWGSYRAAIIIYHQSSGIYFICDKYRQNVKNKKEAIIVMYSYLTSLNYNVKSDN